MALVPESHVKVPPLEPLEIAAGIIFGRRREALAAADRADAAVLAVRSPRAVLEQLLLSALTSPPCVVAFSGGRDSAAILAVATHVARRHGLDEPIPVTLRYADHPRTWERDWQEQTVRHLGLTHWQTIDINAELEAVGSIASTALKRHGLYWPPNAHTMVPLLEASRGGTLVTGNGGDEVLSAWGWRRVSLIRRARARPRRRDLRPLARSLIPAPLMARLSYARHPMLLPWLLPEPQRETARMWAAKVSQRQRSWRAELDSLAQSRYLELAGGIFEALAADAGARLVQPFLDRRFMDAMAAQMPMEGPPGRTAAMRRYFGDLLPDEVIGRSTKATFTEAFAGPATRAFATGWSGGGPLEGLVDPAAIREQWTKQRPDFRSLTALQAAWLAAGAQE